MTKNEIDAIFKEERDAFEAFANFSKEETNIRVAKEAARFRMTLARDAMRSMQDELLKN